MIPLYEEIVINVSLNKLQFSQQAETKSLESLLDKNILEIIPSIRKEHSEYTIKLAIQANIVLFLLIS